MSNQQQMQFGGSEPEYVHDPDPRFINTDPREQTQEQQQVPYDEYYGYTGSSSYGEKLRPRSSPRQQKSRNSWWLYLILPAALLIFTMVPFALFSKSRPDSWQGMRPMPPFSHEYQLSTSVKTLIIRDDVGSVRIHTGDSKQGPITIRTDGFNGNDFGRKDDRAPIDIEPSQKNSDAAIAKVTVNSDGSFPDAGTVNLDVTVPQGQTLNVQVDDSNNQVTVDGINGNVQVNSSNGDVTASNITGTVQLNSASGSINANHINGQVSLTSQDGSITLGASQISGQSTLRSTNGSVTFDGSIDQHGTYLFESENGSITATLPQNTSARLDLRTNNGAINNDFRTTTIGTDPRPAVTMRSGSGSITVNAGS